MRDASGNAQPPRHVLVVALNVELAVRPPPLHLVVHQLGRLDPHAHAGLGLRLEQERPITPHHDTGGGRRNTLSTATTMLTYKEVRIASYLSTLCTWKQKGRSGMSTGVVLAYMRLAANPTLVDSCIAGKQRRRYALTPTTLTSALLAPRRPEHAPPRRTRVFLYSNMPSLIRNQRRFQDT